MKLITSGSYYKTVLRIAIPIALQNLITISTGMMDTLMLGKADNTGVFLSASSLANQPFFILTLMCFGLSGADSAKTVIIRPHTMHILPTAANGQNMNRINSNIKSISITRMVFIPGCVRNMSSIWQKCSIICICSPC